MDLASLGSSVEPDQERAGSQRSLDAEPRVEILRLSDPRGNRGQALSEGERQVGAERYVLLAPQGVESTEAPEATLRWPTSRFTWVPDECRVCGWIAAIVAASAGLVAL